MQRSILITGCSNGIGLESTLELKYQGSHALAGYRKPDDIGRMNSMGFTGMLVDLDSPESVDRAVSEVIALTDNYLYGISNNAGFGMYGPFSTINRAQMEQQFSVNFFGAHQLTMRLLSAMLPHDEGRIVTTSSTMGLVLTPGRGAYVASKYTLGAWSGILCVELHHSGTKISLIKPGPTRARFTDNVNQTQSDKPVENPGIAARFTLGLEAMVDKVHHVFISEKPKMRYLVTLVTWVIMVLERLLPGHVMGRILQGWTEAHAQAPVPKKISTIESDFMSVGDTVSINESNLQQALERSMTTPVLFCFWSERNQYCLQLTPILGGLAVQHNGQFILAKLDRDAEQMIAAQFGLRATPIVYLFQNGQPADSFQGPQLEETVHAPLDKVLPCGEELKV